jgi:predicted nuclease with TOPRIM domain
MTTQASPAVTSVEERLAALEATLTAFIAEQREWRNQFAAEQLAWRIEVNERFARLESSVDRLNERVDRLSERVDRLSERVDRVEENLGGRIDRLGAHVNRILYVALGGMSSVIVAGVIAIVFGA